MFGFFKKKSKAEKLNEKYQKLLEEAFRLSKTNRTESDAKQAEAEAVLREIDALAK